MIDNQYERIFTEFKENLISLFLKDFGIPEIEKDDYIRKRPVALENVKPNSENHNPVIFLSSGVSRINERISAPVGYIGETLEILVNVVVFADKDKDITIKSSMVRDWMRKVARSSTRVGNTDSEKTTKDARIRRTIPFRARLSRRQDEIDRELLLFVFEIDYIYRKIRL